MYPSLALILLISGFIAMALFFVNQMQGGEKKSVLLELGIGFVASMLLGFGVLFLMLSFGMFP